MPEIGIVETRNIIRAIKQKYNYDFSQYSLTAFRFGLDRTILRHHLRYSELLASRILEDDDFFEDLLFDINDVIVEFFRDPETWILLKNNILPQLFENFSQPKIWLPGVYNNQDIFSLLLLLDTEFPKKNITIQISTLSDKTAGIISKGEITAKQLESGQENFEKVFPKSNLISLLIQKENDFNLDSPYLSGVKIIKQNLLLEPVPESSDLIIFRNNLLNYSVDYQKIILDNLISNLSKDGYLITGIKENIDDYISKHRNVIKISKSERVYCKTNKI